MFVHRVHRRVDCANGNGNHLSNRPHFHTYLFFVGEIAFYHRMSVAPTPSPPPPPGPFSKSAVTLASPKTISHTYTLSAHSALALPSVGHILVLAPFALGVFIFPLSLVVVVSSMLFPYFSPFFLHVPRPASNLFPFNFFPIPNARTPEKKVDIRCETRTRSK